MFGKIPVKKTLEIFRIIKLKVKDLKFSEIMHTPSFLIFNANVFFLNAYFENAYIWASAIAWSKLQADLHSLLFQIILTNGINFDGDSKRKPCLKSAQSIYGLL